MRTRVRRLGLAAAGCLVCAPQGLPLADESVAVGALQVEVRATAEHVERQSPPEPTWTSVGRGDRLSVRDGLRTHERSSAELAFGDGSQLRLSEQSVVFVRRWERVGADDFQGLLEVSAGQADLYLAPPPAAAGAFELVIGGAHAKPSAVGSEPGRIRARHSAGGAAHVMLYAGEADVSAAGRQVRLRRGWGTSVPGSGAPLAPEPLLQAPTLWAPPAGASFDHSNPRFSWDPQRGAASYTVEICRDPECGELLQRATGLQVSRWSPDDLPLSVLYWRVTAVSSSGLDGYSSPPRNFRIRALWHRPEVAPR